MNNITKAFQTKSKLRGMADGGAIFKNNIGGVNTYTDKQNAGAGAQAYTPGQSGRGTFSTVNGPPAITPPPALPTIPPVGAAPPVVTPPSPLAAVPPPPPAAPNYMQAGGAPEPVPFIPAPTAQLGAPPEPPRSILPNFFDEERGFADGGKVHGKGGPTEDKVGPVMLSKGEYVLPADTVEHVGKENLDVLREATHEFKDPKKSALRGMANGGVFEVDPLGRAYQRIANAPALMTQQPFASPAGPGNIPDYRNPNPNAPRAEMFRQTPAPGNPSYRPAPAAAAPAPGVAPVAAAEVASPAAKAGLLSRGAGFVGSALRAAGNIAAPAFTAYTAFNDTPEQRNAAAGGDAGSGVLGGIAQGAGQAGSYLGSALTAGALSPQDIGGAIAGARDMIAGGKTADGEVFGAVPSDKRGWLRNMISPAAATAGSQVQMNPTMAQLEADGALAPAGASGFIQSGIPGIQKRGNEYQGVGTPEPRENPMMAEIRSALRGMTTDQNAGQRNVARFDSSIGRDINKRYDKMLRDGSGRNTKYGMDWSQRHGLSVEKERADALGEDYRNQTTQRGQDISSNSYANSTATNARTSSLQALTGLAERQMTSQGAAQAANLKAIADIGKGEKADEEKGYTRATAAIGKMFPTADGYDTTKQADFTEFVWGSDPKAKEKFAAMGPQDQAAMLQKFVPLYEMRQARNKTATGNLFDNGATTTGITMPADVREATLNDVQNNHLPFGKYVKSNLPFTNKNIMVDESGQPTLMSDAATDSKGNWDMDKLKLIADRTKKDKDGKSTLRGQ